MSSNHSFFPQQSQTSANRATNIINIQQKIANMSASEYMAFMQKLRNSALSTQAENSQQTQQYQQQQQQQQQQYNPSELLLSHHSQLPAHPQQQSSQASQSSFYPATLTQQSTTPENTSNSQLLHSNRLTQEQAKAVSDFLNSLRNGQTQFNQDMLQPSTGTSFSRPLLTSSWFPQSPTQTPPDSYLQSLLANNPAMASPLLTQLSAVSLPQESQLLWPNGLANPIFPPESSDKSDQMYKYRPPSKSSAYLSVPRDVSSFPSPSSAYTPSPALTAFDSNFSEYDPHEESIFPLSENTSPLNTFQTDSLLFGSSYEPGDLLFDPSFNLELSPNPVEDVPETSTMTPLVDTIKTENTESHFSPASGFAGLNIENNQETDFPLFTNLFQSDLSRVHTHGFERSEPIIKTEEIERSWVDDESSSLYSDSEEQEVPRVKKEPGYYKEYEDDSTEDYDEDTPMPGQYGQKSVPPGKKKPAVKVKQEPADTDTYESDDGSMEDEDFEMKSEPESEPDFSTSSDDEFTGTRGRSGRGRRKSTPTSGKITKSSSGTFVCPKCSRDFNRRFNLLTHMKTHDENRPRPFICPNCNANFVRQHDLTRHASVHATSKPHKCPGCGTEFSRRDAMLRHVMQRTKCSRAAEKAEKEAIEKIKIEGENVGLNAAAAGLSRGRGRRRKSDGMSIQKTEIQLLHEDPEAKKVIEEAFRMQRELKKKK